MLYRNEDCESVLCKNFSEKFYDLVKINGYISNHNCISDFIDYLYEFSNFPSTIDYVVRDDKHHEIFCTFDMCGFRYFRIEITFQKDSYVRFVVYRSYDEPAVDVTMKFNVKGFESLFNFSVSQVFHTNEENALEPGQEEQDNPEQLVEDAEEQENPEQTEEDAEEQDNPEQTPAEDAEEQSEIIDTNMGAMPIEDYHDILAYQHGFDSYEEFKKAWCSDDEEFNTSELKLPPAEENKQTIELTPLELTLFELDSNSLKSYYGFCYLSELAEKQGLDDKIIEQYEANASLERHYVDLLRYIIKQAGLQKKYLLWLAERKKQEAVGSSK